MNVTIEEGSRPIKLWTDDIEDAAMQQMRNVARMPFIHPHGVVGMPDVHWGMGATVGSVIATEKAIIPAAVGVDIGCFRGDTKIPLLDGTQATLAELTERTEPFWVYSIDKDQKVAAGRAIALRTRENAELLRVVVSGGDEIFCTPDHEFMLNDGSYRQAADLKFNDSLMPLYRKWQTRDGYESTNNGKGKAQQTHVMVWESLNGSLPAGHVVHHKNHIHFDNRPENLEPMTVSAHSAYHRSVGHKLDNASPVFQRKRRAGIARRKADPVEFQKMVEVGSRNIQTYMKERPEHFEASVAGNGKRGAPYLAKFNTAPRQCVDCGVEAKNPAALRWHKAREHAYNHKVISVTRSEARADVYCLQVEEHHNFALAAGVFVHNCGMNAIRLSLKASDLPDSLLEVRNQIERDVPVGFNQHKDDAKVAGHWKGGTALQERLIFLQQKYPEIKVRAQTTLQQLGTLGGGNHFIELCLDENQDVWVMLHSGSRGTGNTIGRYFIDRAKEECARWHIRLPDNDLAYLPEGTDLFKGYVEAVSWAQDYALANRATMMSLTLAALRRRIDKPFEVTKEAINCHHNYVEKENHFGRNVYVTRKGAIRAREGDLGIIPGSMGQRSFIVRGKGNLDSYCSCSHGAGRRMSRNEAKKTFSLSDLVAQTQGVECRKDEGVIDEAPGAYKDIDDVMANQTDLVEVLHTLKQVVCIKG